MDGSMWTNNVNNLLRIEISISSSIGSVVTVVSLSTINTNASRKLSANKSELIF